MSFKDFLRELAVEIAAFVAAAAFIVVVAVRYSGWAALVGSVLLIAFSVYKIVKFFNIRNRERQLRDMASHSLDATDAGSVNDFPMPMLVCDGDGIIELFNRSFFHTFMDESVIDRKLAQPFIGGCDPEQAESNGAAIVKIKDSYYIVTPSSFEFKGGKEYVFYFTDVSEMKRAQLAYIKNRPIIMLLQTDDIADIKADYRDSERAAIRGGVEEVIENWTGQYDCIMRKISEERFMIIAQSDVLEKMRADRFSVLDKIREYKYKERVLGLTLSIGVGTGVAITDCEKSAEQALDMALGRGGDQAVVKDGTKIRYYGGKSQQLEKTTRVKARVKAHAMRELMDTKDKMLIMGHKIGDTDSFGAAIGIWRIATSFNKKARIVINGVNSSVKPMMARFENSSDYPEDLFLTGEEAAEWADSNTMLVVVDVNRPSITEAPELLKQIKTIVVLDHHRQSSEIIDNAVLSYVEPYASSACEMVAEVLQYIGDDGIKIKPAEADAMYAGIVIDTNNFMNQAGVRTFEAAAFLRRNGADVVRVRKLFRDRLEDYRARAEAIQKAEIYHGAFAISVCPSEGLESPTVVGAQAANELLDIVGIKASFILTQMGDTIYFSARSIDEINVQIIMERLGGGGHRTIAGAQLKGATIDEAREKLKDLITDMMEKGEI